MIRLSAVILALLLLVSSVSGQALFTKKGGSSFGGFVSYAHNSAADGLGLDVAFCPMNMVELGATANTISQDGPDAVVLAPYVNILPVNENGGKVPFSLNCGLSYGYMMTSGSTSSDGYAMAAGATIHKNLPLSDRFIAQPYVGFGLENSEFSDSDNGGIFGLTFFVKTGRKNGVTLTSAFSAYESGTTVSFTVGLVGGTGIVGSSGSSETDVWKD